MENETGTLADPTSSDDGQITAKLDILIKGLGGLLFGTLSYKIVTLQFSSTWDC